MRRGELSAFKHAGFWHPMDTLRDKVRRTGLEYFKVVGLDLGDVDLVVDRMRTTRARAKFTPAGERGWTLSVPEGWYSAPEEAMTLDARLEYRASLHEFELA